MSGIKTFNKKSRKGISPVIATVILVAVAVVIAAALAGFSSSLFGTYSSSGAAITVQKIEVHATSAPDQILLTLANGGNVADELVSMQIPPGQPIDQAAFTTTNAFDSTGAAVPGSLQVSPGGTFVAGADSLLDFDEGQQITVRMTMKSGLQLTQSVIVIA